MAKLFFERLREYYLKVGEVLRGEADSAAIFPNSSDIGTSRERIFTEFIKQHAPSKCNVFAGGFLFDQHGNESKQLDVIITTDTTPRFDLHNYDGKGKSFSPVEGTLGIASIKSSLDKKQLYDALENVASIPETQPLGDRISFAIQIKDYEDWPYKIIYASAGLEGETILKHLTTFYELNPAIPIHRRPNIIHVAGKFAIIRAEEGMIQNDIRTGQKVDVEVGKYLLTKRDPDLHSIMWIINSLQENAIASNEIHFNYSWIINRVHGINDTPPNSQ